MSPSLYRYLSSGDLRIVENSRTIRDFRFEGDIWPIVDDWVKESGFKILESSVSERLYKRGYLVFSMLKIKEAEGDVHFEAWIRVTPLMWGPMEVPFESGKYTVYHGWVPHIKKRRELVNGLLKKFGQNKIL